MNFAKGFTLIELAMVLFIVSLLLGGLLVPLATQLEGRQRNEARQQLERIEEALIGFAIINNRLPCPTTQADPANENYGLEGAPCNGAVATEGFLPWKTLGVREVDPWGIPRTATTDPWNGYWRYRADKNFTTRIIDPPPFDKLITLGTPFIDNLTIQNSSNNLLTSTTERPIAIIYSTGANLTQDGQNTSYEQNPTGNATGWNPPAQGWPLYQGGTVSGNFDDITIWISRPSLFNYMVRAGKLP